MSYQWRVDNGTVNGQGRNTIVRISSPDKDNDTEIEKWYTDYCGDEISIYVPFDILAAYVDYHRNKINEPRT